MHNLNVYTRQQRVAIPLKEELLGGSLDQLRKYVLGILGYSTQLYLYREPLSTFSRLDFIVPTACLLEVLGEFGPVCLTYNNRQHLEEPDFLSPFPKSANDLMVVAQTCRQNAFSFERYKIDSSAPVSFAKNIASRIARDTYVLYHQLRIHINQFSNEETVSATLAKLAYPNYVVLLTADDETTDELYQQVHNPALIDFEEYYVICLGEGREIVMNRQAEWQVVAYMLSLIFKTSFRVDGRQEGSQGFTVDKTVNRVTLVKESTATALLPALTLSFFLGQTQSYLIFLEQSSILHAYSRHPPFRLINSVVLCCEPCTYLQEQIPVLFDGQLIMYSITVSCIILKYYTLPLGELKEVRHYRWEKEYGAVQADTLDLIAVNYKGSLLRVFYVHDPTNFLELRKPEADWFITVSKIGYNVLSDGSGLFAIGGRNRQTFDVYNILSLQRQASITLNSFTSKPLSVSFHREGEGLLFTNEQRCFEYGFDGKLRNSYKKQSKVTIYCYGPSGAIFIATPCTFQWLHSRELRVKQGVLITGGTALSFNVGLQAGSFNLIYQYEK